MVKFDMDIPDRKVLSGFLLAGMGFQEFKKYGITLASVMSTCEEKLSK